MKNSHDGKPWVEVVSKAKEVSDESADRSLYAQAGLYLTGGVREV